MPGWQGVTALLWTVLAGLLLTGASNGPDFGHYADWVWVFQSGNIARIGGDVLSPMRVPLSQWSFGPGLVFAAGSTFGGTTTSGSVLAVGWVAILAFWLVMYRILERVTGRNQPLVFLGLGMCFVGTHLGVYSTALSSESLSYTCLALAAFAAIETREWGPLESLALGVPAALLLMVRPQLGLCLTPILVTAIVSALRSRAPIPHKLFGLAALCVPLAVAMAEILITNRWMSGSVFRSPYAFGGPEFKSIDLARPEFAAVLVHPWHGLLVYHPLYAVLLGMPFLMIAEKRPATEKVLLLSLALAALLQLYVHASWYVWWLGTSTFGQRGMGTSALLLVPIACRYMAERRGHWSTRSLVAVILGASAWSALLMQQGNTQFYTWEQLWLAQVATFGNVLSHHAPVLVAALGVVAAVTWVHRSLDAADRRLSRAAYTLGALTVLHLAGKWTSPSDLASRLQAALPILLAMGASGVLSERLTRRWRQEPDRDRLRMTLVGALGAVFVVSIGLFLRATIRTETAIRDRSVAIARFNFKGPVYLKELVESYDEYHRITGFGRKKAALRRFINGATQEEKHDLELERAATVEREQAAERSPAPPSAR